MEGNMEMDDEAFARMLQQQLLDEERELMEQQQAQQAQQQQYQQPHHQQQQHHHHHQQPQQQHHHHHQQPQQYQQHHYPPHQQPQSHEFNMEEYARRLEQEGFLKSQDGAPSSGMTRSGASPYVEATPTGSEDADLELARRMQELETMGMGRMNSRIMQSGQTEQSLPSMGSGGASSAGVGGGPVRSRAAQEEEDARLARFIAESGQSLNAIDYGSNVHGGGMSGGPATGNMRNTGRSSSPPNGQLTPHIESQWETQAPPQQRNTHLHPGGQQPHPPTRPSPNQGQSWGYPSDQSGVPKAPSHYSDPHILHRKPSPQYGDASSSAVPQVPLPPHSRAPPQPYGDPNTGPPATQRKAPPPQYSEQPRPGDQVPFPNSVPFNPHQNRYPPQQSRQAPPPHQQNEVEISLSAHYGGPRSLPPNTDPRSQFEQGGPPTPYNLHRPQQQQQQQQLREQPKPPQSRTQGGVPNPHNPHNPNPHGAPPAQMNKVSQQPRSMGHSSQSLPNNNQFSRAPNTRSRSDDLNMNNPRTPDMNPMDKMDVFLDIPVPAKKEKKKKRGLFGFGRRNGANEETNEKEKEQPKPTKPKTPGRPANATRNESTGTARSFGLGGFRGGGNNSNNNNNNSSGGSRNTAPPEKNGPGTEQNEAEYTAPVVPFPIPEPVARPADTIGAPPGPLPYSLTVSREVPTAPEETVGRGARMALGRNSGTCSVCLQPANNPLNALDKKFHIECFRCLACHEQIDPSGPFAFVDNYGDKQPMHRRCYAELYGIKCAVCKQSIPAGPDGKVSFVKHPFFDTEQMCPRHAKSLTRRCTGCHRFEPEGEPFADLNDVGRCVCLSCCRTVIVDSQDAQPLWNLVVDFFENKLNLPIWKDFREVPILVVGYNALNDQMSNSSNVHGGASQIMTRGLCLTEHESGRRFKTNRLKFNKNNMSFVACDAEERGFTYFQVPDANKVNPDASVTAILCLSGLPQDLAASVLAHEATHAWIKLHPRFDIEHPIPPQVEEGCAQLIALLFLNDGLAPPPPLQNNDGTGPSDEKLRQYFKFSIETDDHEIYGTGYRRAAMAYSKIGIEALMSHVVLYQNFPET